MRPRAGRALALSGSASARGLGMRHAPASEAAFGLQAPAARIGDNEIFRAADNRRWAFRQ